jgi:hypothetical protein
MTDFVVIFALKFDTEVLLIGDIKCSNISLKTKKGSIAMQKIAYIFLSETPELRIV